MYNQDAPGKCSKVGTQMNHSHIAVVFILMSVMLNITLILLSSLPNL